MTFQVEFATQPKVLNVEFDTALNISGGYDDGYNDGFSQGKSEGLTEGEEIGYGKGETVGYENGYTEGDAKGYERGLTDGNANAMQEFVTKRDLAYLYYRPSYYPTDELTAAVTNESVAWLSHTDTSKCTNARSMFYYCTGNGFTEPPLFDTSGVTNMNMMFHMGYQNRGQKLTIPIYDTRNVTDMYSMFSGCKFTDEGYNNICKLDVSKVTNVGQMFEYSPYEFPKPVWSVMPSATNAPYIYKESNILSVDELSLPKATSAYGIFFKCNKLTTVNHISLPSGTDVASMFSECSSKLSYVGRVDLCITDGKSVSATNFFGACKVLETVGFMDLRQVGNAGSMFNNCYKLANLTVKNIRANLQVGSGTTYGHLLTLESLIGLCYELRDTGATKTLTVGSANLEKLANVYVREIPITDAMREADDLIDEKLPFERCESTADGATLITDYVLLKNWKLA